MSDMSEAYQEGLVALEAANMALRRLCSEAERADRVKSARLAALEAVVEAAEKYRAVRVACVTTNPSVLGNRAIHRIADRDRWTVAYRALCAALDAAKGTTHGVNCPKMPHAFGGYLHTEHDDSPYDVDGLAYCGRCHGYLDAAKEAK